MRVLTTQPVPVVVIFLFLSLLIILLNIRPTTAGLTITMNMT